MEQRLQAKLGDLVAAVDVVIAVHENLWLDDRNEILVLAQRGIAGERIGIGLDAVIARDSRSDVDHRAPLAEFGAEAAIFDEPLAQAVEAFGDDLARIEG